MKLVWLVMAILMLATVGWAGEKEELQQKAREYDTRFQCNQGELTSLLTIQNIINERIINKRNESDRLKVEFDQIQKRLKQIEVEETKKVIEKPEIKK